MPLNLRDIIGFFDDLYNIYHCLMFLTIISFNFFIIYYVLSFHLLILLLVLGLPSPFEAASQTEVTYLDSAIVIDQDVSRLQISVDDLALVQII